MKNNLKLRFTVSKSKFNVEKIHAMAFVKQGHPLLSVFNKIHYVMAGSPTRNWVRVFKLYLYKLNLLYKRNGTKGVVKYLKVCSVLLQQVVSGYKISDLGPLGLRVSRSKSGLPRIIPKYHRKMILSRDKKVIRLWLTLFSIYRDLHFAGELKIKTITDPSTATSRSSEVSSLVAPFIKLYWKPNDFIFKDLLATFPMLTSGPQASRADGEYNSHPKVVLRSLTLFLQDRNKDLKESLVKVLEITNNLHILKLFYELGVKAGNSFASRPRSSFLGRLAIKEEAAGKVRVFAMVDPWTQ